MSGGEVIEIEYQLTVDDYAKFNADVGMTDAQRRAGAAGLVRIYKIFICAVLVITFSSFFIRVSKAEIEISDFWHYAFESFVKAAPPFFIITFFVLYLRYIGKKSLHSRFKAICRRMLNVGENKAILSPAKLAFTKGQIIHSSEFLKCEYYWSGIEKVEILNGDLYLFLSALSALIVPARFFKSEEEKQRVYEQCVKWWKSAQEKAA
ncbi:MAG: YcxB family protein [Alphaproteobacteria bacterium]|nr:YcxB family protein [Alphaproteobacteria bacterium]